MMIRIGDHDINPDHITSIEPHPHDTARVMVRCFGGYMYPITHEQREWLFETINELEGVRDGLTSNLIYTLPSWLTWKPAEDVEEARDGSE